MTLRAGHGKGAGKPRIEIMPADELPDGVPGDARPAVRTGRGADGRFGKGNPWAREAARARGAHSRLANSLGLAELAADAAFRPYRAAADEFQRAHRNELAMTVGGGHVGPGPASIIGTAALQLAASRYLSDKAAATGDTALFLSASRLGDAHRQNLLAAHELCAREAEARRKMPTPTHAVSWLAQGNDEGGDDA